MLLAPAALLAVTLKVYSTPFVKPVTVIGLAGPDAVMPPGLAVTVYEVIGAPPVNTGGIIDTVTCVSPGVNEFMNGSPGIIGLTVNDRLTWGAPQPPSR